MKKNKHNTRSYAQAPKENTKIQASVWRGSELRHWTLPEMVFSQNVNIVEKFYEYELKKRKNM